MKKTLSRPELLEIAHTEESAAIGGSQDWYNDKWHQMSGCGPTAASNLIWYLSRSRTELNGICTVGDGDRLNYMSLQHEMFGYVTPGRGGVNRVFIFTEGILRYCEAHKASLRAQHLEVPRKPAKRPSADEVRDFVRQGIESDCPVAFLNLSNGTLKNLDAWHWVTIVEFDPDTMQTTISDQGLLLEIDLGEWLKTSILGGAFSYLHEAE